MAINALALSTLKHLQIATEAQDRGAPFRTFFDNFYAYYVGGPFLNQSGRPHWHNNPCPRRHREALLHSHFVSVPAMRVLAGLSEERLIKDHAIPVSVLRELFLEDGCNTLERVHSLMSRFYRIGIITAFEDALLTSRGLRSRMPSGWRMSDDPFARYESVGITAQQLREEL